VTRRAALVAPGPVGQRTGGYIYNQRIVEGLVSRGWGLDVVVLDPSFPHPTAEALGDAANKLTHLPAGTVTIVDSLALGAMPELIEQQSSRLRFVALVHLPLTASASPKSTSWSWVLQAERRALAATALVVVTGRTTVGLLTPLGVLPDRIAVVEPGTDPAPLARGSHRGPGQTLELFCAATVNAFKGHDLLLQALGAIDRPDWHLTCAGSLTRDPDVSAYVLGLVDSLGLGPRVEFSGELDEAALAARFDRADAFVLASRQETYGMAVAEALARGLPVVATRTGAIADLVGDDAGIVVPVNDCQALMTALDRLIGDSAHRDRLARGAARVRERLATWDDASARFASTIERLAYE
jgi:glycosyltransferase involved in cell wall biosynthesis